MQGINCRFGSRGIIAEAHYDGGRNFVAMLKGTNDMRHSHSTGRFICNDEITLSFRLLPHAIGAKRYVLLPPSECSLLYLYDRNHPEGEEGEGAAARDKGTFACSDK